MAKVTQGGDLMVYIGGKSIAFATSHTLSISGEAAEITSKDNGGYWAASDYKKASWSISCECLMSNSTDGKTVNDLFTAFTGKTTLDVVFAPKTSAEASLDEVPSGGWSAPTAGKFSGKVIISSLSISAPNGDNATFSVELTGTGALTYTAAA